jgi:hypothetical protein
MNVLVAANQSSVRKDQRRCLRVIIYQTVRLIYRVRGRERIAEKAELVGCGLQSVFHSDSDYILNIFSNLYPCLVLGSPHKGIACLCAARDAFLCCRSVVWNFYCSDRPRKQSHSVRKIFMASDLIVSWYRSKSRRVRSSGGDRLVMVVVLGIIT